MNLVRIVRTVFLLLLSFSVSLPIFAQQMTVASITTLPAAVSETSGLIFLNGKLITHNDSGGQPVLYEIDTVSGNVTRSVFIDNATNVDWEDICYDNNYIYIGDFGNNQGTRTNLKIYRIAIADYVTNANDTVQADIIEFDYADQVLFVPMQFVTNYDAEALIAYNNSLYVFTKNWGDLQSRIYPVPNVPGNYSVNAVDTLNSQGMITGATFNSQANAIMLVGYNFFSPFLIELSQFSGNQFSDGTVRRYEPAISGSFQTEAVATIDESHYFLSSEAAGSFSPELFRITMTDIGSSGCVWIEQVFSENVTTSSARLRWQPNIAANHYEIRGRNILNNNWVNINITNPTDSFRNVFGLTNNTSFVWQIRAWCDAAETDSSDWSALDTFTTGCFSPAALWTDPVTSNGARLNWVEADGAQGYEIRGQRIGSSGWVNLLVNGGSTVQKDVFGLMATNQYHWKIRSWCSPSGSVVSAYTVLDTFVTNAASRLANDSKSPFSVFNFEEVAVYPNPSRGEFRVSFAHSSQIAGNVQVIAFDELGRNIFSESLKNPPFHLNLTHLPEGIYSLLLQTADETKTLRKVAVIR